MLKQFSGEKILSPVEMGPKNGGSWGKMGVDTLDFGLATPKGISCSEPRRMTYFASKSVHSSRL